MHFQNYIFPKTWLVKYQKVPLQSALGKATWEIGRKTAEILPAARLSYLLIIVKAVAFEKVTLSDIQNLKNLC